MMRILEKYDTSLVYTGVAMNLLLAFQYFKFWCWPQYGDIDTITTLTLFITFEFILVHSGVFMALAPRKMSLFLFFPFYGVFAYGFFKAGNNPFIIVSYLLIMLNRMRFAFSDVSEAIRSRAILTSILAAGIYFVLIFVVLFSQSILPDLGLNEPFLKQSGYFEQNSSGGLFNEDPKTALCLGCIYYLILALIEVKLINRAQKSSNATR